MQLNEYNYQLQCEVLRLLYTFEELSYNTAVSIAYSLFTYQDNKLNKWSNE